MPGVSETDSHSYRIEALRVYLEEKLGDINFIAAYKYYITASECSEATAEVENILGEKHKKYVGLIYQLIVWEFTHYKLP